MEIYKENEKADIKLVGAIELPKFDATQYIGKKEKIANVEIFNGEFGFYLKLTSTIIDVLKGKDKKEIRATKNFSLYTGEDGQTGWGTESKLAEYLILKGCSTPEQLLGKDVVVQVENKGTKQYLTFL